MACVSRRGFADSQSAAVGDEAFAEFECELIRERQREVIALPKQRDINRAALYEDLRTGE